MTTDCPSADLLRQYLDDRLAPEAEAALVTHVEDCESCKQRMEMLTAANMTSLSLAPPAAPTLFRSGYRERLAQLAPVRSSASTWPGLSALVDTPRPVPESAIGAPPARAKGQAARLGSYDILEELGRGGMGIVYLARDTRLGRKVALKMIRGNEFDDLEQQARFLAEAQAIAKLQHPHIVQLYEMGTLDGRLYCALEYIPGGSLAKHLTGRPLPAEQAAAVLEPLARAVHHAHQQGIVHRDLKPANILLQMTNEERKMKNEDPRLATSDIFHWSLFTPKITDFGLAKRLQEEDGLTKTGVILGTPSYMAPEQAKGTKEVGPAADIYALGAILYECVTARPPFLGATPLETIDSVLQAEPLPPSRLQWKLPRDLETICLKCLEKEPSRRYATAEALADDLGRFRRGEPILARPVPQHERLWRWCRRNPLATSFLTTLFLAVVAMAGLAGWAMQERDQAEQQAQRADQNALKATQQARLAEEKRQEAVKLRQEADKQRQEALANLEQAKRAVDNCFRLTQQNPLFQGDAQKARRRLLLEQAKPFYEQFVQQQSDDPAVLEGQADILWKLSIIYGEVGPMKEGLKALQHTIKLYQRLAHLQPQVRKWHISVAASYINCGTLHHKLTQPQEALTCFVEAEKLQRKLLQAPNLTRAELRKLQVDLSLACNNQGVLHRDLGQAAQALTYFLKAKEMQQQLLETYPTSLEIRINFANSLLNIATVCQDLQQFSESLDYHRQAGRAWENLANEEPQRLDFQAELARSWQGLGKTYDLLGDTDQALQAYRQAKQRYEQVLARQPRFVQAGVLLGSTCCNMGHLLRQQGDYSQAAAAYAQARSVLQGVRAREPHEHQVSTYLGNTHLGQGYLWKVLHRYTAAAAEWRHGSELVTGEEREMTKRRLADCMSFARLEQASVVALGLALGSPGSPPGVLTGQLAVRFLWLMPLP
jgi:serine/threonine-protein kinase